MDQEVLASIQWRDVVNVLAIVAAGFTFRLVKRVWWFVDFKEARALTPEDRVALREEISAAMRKAITGRSVVLTLVCYCAGLLVFFALPLLYPRVLRHLPIGVWLLIVVVAYEWALLILCGRYDSSYKATMRHALCRAGLKVCISCGYDLRGTLTELCPECGERNAA